MNDSNKKDYSIDKRLVSMAFDAAAKDYDAVSLLQQTVADRLIESLDLIKINPLSILDLGSGTGYGSKRLKQRFKRARYFQCDISIEMLKVAHKHSPAFFSRNHFLCADAGKLPLLDNQFDLVFSSLMLQWCDNLDVVFAEVKRLLKPGGMFLFASFGPDSLKELRECWQRVDEHVHVNAFVDMHDIGDALMRKGLSEPVLNVEHIVLTYDDCKQLMRELKSIGAHNVNEGRRKSLTGKQRINKVVAHYETFRSENKLPATYEVVYGHAWQRQSVKSSARETGPQTISLDKVKQSLKARNTE